MNKIEKKMTDNKQRSNYHKTNNAKNSQGSLSENKRRRQVSSIPNYSPNKQNQKRSSSHRSSSNSRSIQTRKKSNVNNPKFNKQQQQKRRKLPNKIKNNDQPCYHWMEGKCRNFELCKFRHYQMSKISFKQNNNNNKTESINQQMHNQQKILVQLEQTTLMTTEQLIQLILKTPDNISNTIKISYKNKKAINKLKNQLYKNQRDVYTNKANKLKEEEKILNELLQNTQTDNKNSNALKIKEKIERIKKEQEEKKLIMNKKPKITIKKENEEKEVQNQIINIDQSQLKKNEQIIIETNEESDEEINTSLPKTQMFFIQSKTKPIKKKLKIPQNTQQQNNTSQLNSQLSQNRHPTQQKTINSSQNLKQVLSNTNSKNPLTSQSNTYIEQKDNILNTSYLDHEIKQDMIWSQNIKSPFLQWKQTRDGINKQNIDPSSLENTNKQPSYTNNQSEIMEFIEKSNNKELYDWKQIYKYKAYRNDELQNFISHQNPKTLEIDKYKTICLAVDYMEDGALKEAYQKFNNDNHKLKEQGRIQEILNIFYNKDLLNINTEKYDPIEIQADFLKADTNPEQSHFCKMAQVINKYIKHQFEYIAKSKISTAQDQYQSNILAIIQVLKQLIQHHNYDPHQLIYQTNQGPRLIIFYPSWALNWELVYPDYKQLQQLFYDKNKQNNSNKL